jgi:cellulose synthase/poly-beta-1,6-N-acetylglucosamine synthase-like glycosyltransferase
VVRAAATLAALDHPRARLEVLLVCPAHDTAGVRAARQLARRPGHRLVVVPPSVPAHHGALLAYGLLLARGEHVGVLDPGSVPAPDLLRSAGEVLRSGGPRLAAVQTSLAPPAGGGLLAAWLAGECAAWHELIAPGLGRLRLPLPLASSGLVARREALEECAGWDPSCPAEGVDLGLRLHKCGYRARPVDVAVGIPGTTAPGRWVQAHARWWMGALSAWLVQLRHPLHGIRRMGITGAVATTLLGLAGVVAPLLWLPVLAVAALGALQELGATSDLLPEAVVRLAGAQILVASVVLVLFGVAGSLRRRSPLAAACALLAPLGFSLVAVGAWIGAAGTLAGIGRPRD